MGVDSIFRLPNPPPARACPDAAFRKPVAQSPQERERVFFGEPNGQGGLRFQPRRVAVAVHGPGRDLSLHRIIHPSDRLPRALQPARARLSCSEPSSLSGCQDCCSQRRSRGGKGAPPYRASRLASVPARCPYCGARSEPAGFRVGVLPQRLAISLRFISTLHHT